MKTVKNIENAGRQAWLAGLGVVLLGKEYAAKKFDEVFESTNALINEMMSKGSAIEGDLKALLSDKKVDEAKIAELREKLGLNKESKEDSLTKLSAKVDTLTDVVNKLVAQQKAEAKPAAKPATKPAATKAPAAKPKTPAKPATATKSTVNKPTTKRAPAKKPAAKPSGQ